MKSTKKATTYIIEVFRSFEPFLKNFSRSKNLSVLIRLLLGNYSYATNLIQKLHVLNAHLNQTLPTYGYNGQKKIQNFNFFTNDMNFTRYLFLLKQTVLP